MVGEKKQSLPDTEAIAKRKKLIFLLEQVLFLC